VPVSVTARGPNTGQAVLVAALAAGGAIAFQVAAKATRDALFLSTFGVEALPAMIMASSGISLLLAALAARVISRLGPSRVVPALFGLSASLLLLEWGASTRTLEVAAVAVFLHYGGFGALLVSGLWSVVSERFDPRTAKRQIGWIGVGGTVGGLLGGLVASQVSVNHLFPVLAGLHFTSAGLVLNLGAGSGQGVGTPGARSEPREAAPRSGWAVVAASPYLRNIIGFVLIASVAEGFLDYVFKARATAAFDPDDLLRFFALFYTGVNVLTAVVQALASRPALQRLGLSRVVAMMPGVVALGGAGALMVPGLGSAALARAAEVIMRNSLARSAYELLFVPIGRRDKRATKTLVDVGVVRVGDFLGGALVQVVLLTIVAGAVNPTLLAATVVLGLAAVALARRLHAGYLATLERSLLAHGDQLQADEMEQALTRTALLHSVGDLGLTQLDAGGAELDSAPQPAGDHPAAPVGASEPHTHGTDPELARFVELRSADAARVRTALAAEPITPAVAAHAISLLAWDEVARDVLATLRSAVDRVVGQLVDRLLDPDEEFAVRRRLPLVLASSRDERAVSGLLYGLEDRRFEVRYRSGRALSRIHQLHPDVTVDRARVINAVLREVAVDRAVWEGQRLLDRMDDDVWSPVLDDVLRERASRSLEHVFTVLSLVLAREPLKVAFRGLHTSDQQLRGTALEYLEHALPEQVRVRLWPFLDDAGEGRRQRPSREVLDDLLRSNASITLNLEVRRRLGESD
jgi:hypothetical protein